MKASSTKLPKGFLRKILDAKARNNFLENLSLKRYRKIVDLSRTYELTVCQAEELVRASQLCATLGVSYIHYNYTYIYNNHKVIMDKNLLLLLVWHSGIQDVLELAKFIHRFSDEDIKGLEIRLANGEDIRNAKIWISTDGN